MNPLLSRHLRSAVLGLVLLTSLAPAIAQSCSKHSPPYTVALMELYTSEGCSSCPPADRFLSGLRGTPAAIDRVVPLALHVDYWDYFGWKDGFASPIFTARQRWLSGLAASHTVYTPEVFVGGRELRGWSGGDSAAAIARANAQPARAAIDITLGPIAGSALPIQVKAQSAQSGNLFVALYQNGLSSDVKAGENSGVQLHHDYVVRQWIGPLPLNEGNASLLRSLTVAPQSQGKNLGVAAFVQSGQGEILQALALPVCNQ